MTAIESSPGQLQTITPANVLSSPELSADLISIDVSAPVDVAQTTTLWTDEAELVARAKGDPGAFGPLYERYVDRIYRYIHRRVGDHEEAEDLTAQTFQQALAALPDYQWRGVPFSAWLYRIAGNLVIRHRRIHGREVVMEHVERLVDERGSFDDPLDAIVRQSSRDQLYEAMNLLSFDQRRALILKYSHGLKNHEVGALMSRSEGGVKQLVHRAMLVLRQVINARDAAGRSSRTRVSDASACDEPTSMRDSAHAEPVPSRAS